MNLWQGHCNPWKKLLPKFSNSCMDYCLACYFIVKLSEDACDLSNGALNLFYFL